jgi:hypothetical protein
MKENYQVAAYYFPNYHPDSRNEKWHGKNWTEWELVKRAEPRFEDHQQPKVPIWGYEDESDPQVMAKKIAAAAQHGLTAWIFDWYWYEDGPYLQRCLEAGFLKAVNNHQLKFSLMWANHDWVEIHPATRVRNYATRAKGALSPVAFVAATEHMIANYFSHPSYWRVVGGLYLSFYDLSSLLKGFGSVEAARRGLEDFRNRVRTAGQGELHLNAVVWGEQILPNEEKVENVNELLSQLGFDSVTSYVWVHHHAMESFPKTAYSEFRDLNVKDFDIFTKKYRLPYYPNVSMGWDPSPRTIQSDAYENLGYPFTPILDGNTPEEFEKALIQARSFLDRSELKTKILTINAWNEWTEGSYLEPDRMNGLGYLEAIRTVFGS